MTDFRVSVLELKKTIVELKEKIDELQSQVDNLERTIDVHPLRVGRDMCDHTTREMHKQVCPVCGKLLCYDCAVIPVVREEEDSIFHLCDVYGCVCPQCLVKIQMPRQCDMCGITRKMYQLLSCPRCEKRRCKPCVLVHKCK